MKKIITITTVSALLLLSSCGSNSNSESLSTLDDSGNTYEGYTLIIQDVVGKDADEDVGNIVVTSRDDVTEINTNINDKDIVYSIDDEKKTITLQGNGNHREDSVVIDIVGNISKIEFINSNLEADLNLTTVNDLSIHSTGQIDGEVNVNANNLFVTTDGAASLDVNGQVNWSNILINGAGEIDAYDLLTDTADVTINGAGVCEVNATTTLNAVINGAGVIEYKGTPAVNESVEGIGKVMPEIDD